jgi:serine protease DegQ
MNRYSDGRSSPGPLALAGATVALVATTVVGCTFGTPDGGGTGAPTSETGQSTSGAAEPPGETRTIPAIVDAVEPSVVTIFTQDGLGSGVVYRADGVILTNEHVVRGARSVEVAFADGQRVDGEVLATDPIVDLALVRADRTDLPAADFATALPEVGEGAVVIGSPLGFENTVTSGIISALHRQIPGSAATSSSLVDLIQTDAAISPGNSGGALVNLRAEIIGISEAYIPPSAGAVALGFAIPAITATEVAEELLDDGTADHAFLGLGPGAITPQIAEQLGLAQSDGVVVLSVVDGGPAEEAGLQPGDVLVRLDEETLRSPEDLLGVLRQHDPGDEVTIEFLRGNESETTEATLADRPS